ncbi:MAG TPA: M23 family metallopeptidase [Candidatus Methylomirabilis sp.]|nr:M23 family metallopeptidase [Candidatus Methylomirabilis sp.]
MLVAVLVLLSAGARGEGAPSLALPIDCEIGKSCIVQNYVDQDAGPGARDYRCGWLTYDGHKGTDIRVIDGALLKRGVAVLAAAPGRVRAVRDGMRDVSVRTIGKAAIARREAGNSVVIEHGDGWESQYAHMREGSVAVRAGDVVQSGDRLGIVGLSGATEFPHLHFEVRYRGKPVDPFTGVEQREACQAGDAALWQRQATQALAYVPTGVLDAGIAGAPPVVAAGFVDRDKIEVFTSASGAAVFWVQIYGAQANDLEQFRLIAPDGRVLAERRDLISRNRAQWLAYVGVRRADADWLAGTYRGVYALYRGPQQLITLERAVKLGSR